MGAIVEGERREREKEEEDEEEWKGFLLKGKG